MTTSGSELVRSMLQEYGEMARTALRPYLRPPEPRNEVYDLASDYPQRGGRALRASLCISCARAFGASADDALQSAIALELMHNAFLVHDDVEDGSEQRRGLPTLHAMHGVPIAVNVGDALTVMSLRPLIQNRALLGPRLALRVLEETERMARESVEGQAIELAWRRDNAVDLGDADYLQMILKKTCWYTTIYPCRIGALIGTRDGAELDDYIRFGFFLGAAFQIQDDLLNLVGDERRYGKELEGDLWEGKRTLMLIRLFRAAPPEERLELRRIMAMNRGERTSDDVRWVRSRIDEHECVEYGRQVAHGLAGAAAHEFELTFRNVRDSRDKDFLRSLSTWVLERT